MYNKRNL